MVVTGQLQSDTDDYWERVILLQQSANYDSRQNENKQKSVSHNIVPPWTGGRDVLKCSLAGWLDAIYIDLARPRKTSPVSILVLIFFANNREWRN